MEHTVLSGREKYKSYHTLVCLLQSLQGRKTTVEMRNEATATGIIRHVDGFMNVKMASVKFVDPKGRQNFLETFFVQGKMIRYVQIPDDVSIKDAIAKQVKRPSKKIAKYIKKGKVPNR